MARKTLLERINSGWKLDTKTGCHNWFKSGIHGGYGRLRGHDGKLWLVTRALWELVNGIIPDKLCVCHKCDNPACVNINHLFLDTHQGNMSDKVKKGRSARPVGANNPKAKLKEKDVIDIYSKRDSGINTDELLLLYPLLSRSAINNVLTGRTWKKVWIDYTSSR